MRSDCRQVLAESVSRALTSSPVQLEQPAGSVLLGSWTVECGRLADLEARSFPCYHGLLFHLICHCFNRWQPLFWSQELSSLPCPWTLACAVAPPPPPSSSWGFSVWVWFAFLLLCSKHEVLSTGPLNCAVEVSICVIFGG